MSNRVIKLIVTGATGKMGREVVKLALDTPDLELVGAIDHHCIGQTVSQALGLSPELIGANVVISDDLEQVLKTAEPDAGVDFTNPEAVMPNVRKMIAYGCCPVIGTSGFNDDTVSELKALLEQKSLGGMLVPNFAIGAVLMMMFAEKAAEYFEHGEIIEYHHNQKLDAPSGTATHTLNRMAAVRAKGFNPAQVTETETLPGSRGGRHPGGLNVHSVRLPGLVAHQEVLLSDGGQMLTLRHDSWNRAGFMPGVALAIRHAVKSTGLTMGLDAIL